MGIQDLYNPETGAYEYKPSEMLDIKRGEYEDFAARQKRTYDHYSSLIEDVNKQRKEWLGDNAELVTVGEYVPPTYEQWASGEYSLTANNPEFTPFDDMSWTDKGMYSYDTNSWNMPKDQMGINDGAKWGSYHPSYAVYYNQGYMDQHKADNPEYWAQKDAEYRAARRDAIRTQSSAQPSVGADPTVPQEETLADRQAEYERINIGAPRTGAFMSGYNASRGNASPAAPSSVPPAVSGMVDGGPNDGRGMLSNNATRYTGPFTPDEAGRAAGRPQTGGTTPMPNEPMPTRYEPTKPVFGRADGGPNDQRGMFSGGAKGWDERVRRAREQAQRPNAVSRMFRDMLPND